MRRVRSRSVDSLVKEIAEKGVVSGSELTLVRNLHEHTCGHCCRAMMKTDEW